jgi:hypothetical protein
MGKIVNEMTGRENGQKSPKGNQGFEPGQLAVCWKVRMSYLNILNRKINDIYIFILVIFLLQIGWTKKAFMPIIACQLPTLLYYLTLFII